MVSSITQPCCCLGRWHCWGMLPLITLILAACSNQPQDRANKAAIKIGVIAPLTGQLESIAQPNLNGIKAAIDDINTAGGIQGKSVELVVKDAEGELEPSLKAAETLITEEKVVGIIGTWASRNTIAIAKQVTSQQSIPQIAYASTSPAITTLEEQDFLFRTAPSDSFQGIALAAIARDKRLEKLAILYLNDAYGKGLADSVQSAFEARGGKITGAIPFEPKQTSFEKELAKLAIGKADAVVLIGFPDEGSKIIEQASKTGKFEQFILTDSLKSPQVVQAAGNRGLNISFGTAPQAFTGTKTYIAFQDSYETKFGELPDVPYTDMAYDATMILALAIAKAGTSEGTAIRDAMREVANSPGVDVGPGEWEKAIAAIENGEDIDYVGASGACEFDENGDVAGTFGHWIVKNGEFVTIEAMLVK